MQKQAVVWWNILLEILWQVDDQLGAAPYALQLPDDLRDDATEWLARIVTEKTTRKEMETSFEAEFGASAGVSFFAKARAGIKALVKAGSTTVQKIETEAERRPMILLEAVAALIREANQLLAQSGRHGLVVIADGLEKIPLRSLGDGLTSHNTLFLHNSSRLKAPPCHLVYTFPLALMNSAHLGQVFPELPLLMPMLHVCHRDGSEDDAALGLMTEVVARRVALALFEPDVVHQLALASGGHIRDFLRLVRDAAAGFGEHITEVDARRAIAALRDFYDRLIEQGLVQTLDHVRDHQSLPGGPSDGEVVSRLLTLEYRNDESWTALHPCVTTAPRYVRAARDL